MNNDNKEIERKFLVKDDSWTNKIVETVHIRQGYPIRDYSSVCRVRIAYHSVPVAYMTVKKSISSGVRHEFEFEIPVHQAEAMLDELCGKYIISKLRHTVAIDNVLWTVDEIKGAFENLTLAEIELEDINDYVVLPSWIGQEVTDEPQYSNDALACDGRYIESPLVETI